jgi:glycosyltransferase involved in cell wall biosynthesis
MPSPASENAPLLHEQPKQLDTAVRFSLILCTLGRTSELTRFLEHLAAQTFRNFELIVVDQNPDGFLDPILRPFLECFPLLHIKTQERGLSHARNLGLLQVAGDVMGFPDDDCWYPPDFLEQVVHAMANQNGNYDGLTCRCTDENGMDAFNRFDTEPGDVSKYNIWARTNSNSIFVSRRFAAAAQQFDEGLGKGTASDTAAEEMEFLLRGMSRGLRIFYRPELLVYHRRKVRTYDAAATLEARNHATGQGYVLRRYGYAFPYVLYFCARPLGGVLLAAATGNWRRLRYHIAMMRGRVEGWMA